MSELTRPRVSQSTPGNLRRLSSHHHPRPVRQTEHGGEEVVDVVGPLCENSDKFAKQRLLPKTVEGDIMVQHDTGAHSPAMGELYAGCGPSSYCFGPTAQWN